MEKKAMTMRLDADQADDLAAIAQVQGGTVADEVRAAIKRHIEERKRDRDFQRRLKETLSRNKAILDRLAK